MTVTTKDLLRSLASTVCPACGGKKNASMTLCSRDYHRLPATTAVALYRRVGAGYEEAIAEAFRYLRAGDFILPPPALAEPAKAIDPNLWGA